MSEIIDIKENEIAGIKDELISIDDISSSCIKLVLKGDKYNIDFSMAGMKLLAQKYGSVNNALSRIEKINADFTSEDIEFICDLIHAGLIHEYDLTTKQIEKKIYMRDLAYIFETTVKALTNAMPKPKEIETSESGN
jgi:hypothetical protein